MPDQQDLFAEPVLGFGIRQRDEMDVPPFRRGSAI
jgi:hypothetical protein